MKSLSLSNPSQKNHVFVISQAVTCGAEPRSHRSSLKPNGPAIKGGCVTWRRHPATCPGALAEQLSRWQDRYGVLFAVQVQILLRAGMVAE